MLGMVTEKGEGLMGGFIWQYHQLLCLFGVRLTDISRLLHLMVHFGAMIYSYPYEIFLNVKGEKTYMEARTVLVPRKEAIGDSDIRYMELSLKPYQKYNHG